MAKSAFVRARIEPELKEKAEHILNELGIRPSDAINMFYHQIERTGGLPFHATLRVSLELEEDMKRSIKSITVNILKTVTSSHG